MKNTSRIFIALAALSLIITSYVPLWRIELTAPQYPEGLIMEIWTFKLAGDVEIINGLNHYIGMATMHTEDFIEFKILPYLIWFTLAFGLVVAAFGKKKLLYVYATWVILFGIVAMADFYKWEYDYGHNLDPTAPIQVPGMSYQPPFIGYKLLLNFGAYSIPDIGGFIFIFNALVVVIATFFTWKSAKNKLAPPVAAALAFVMLVFTGCSKDPKQINYGVDPCDFCKMTIVDKRFGGEIISTKGKQYNFDDIKCIVEFVDKKYIQKNKIEAVYLIDYYSGQFIKASPNTPLLLNESLKSPMASNMAAFADAHSCKNAYAAMGGQQLQWMDVYNIHPQSDLMNGL